MKFYIFVIIILISLSGCQHERDVEAPQINTPEVCTREAKVCPDGTVVGRIIPDCEFEACPELPKSQTITYWQNINAPDIFEVHSAYGFSAQIPAKWQVEAVPAIEALNIFDPDFPGENNLEKSQIFIRYFKADAFLTLSTVTIFSQDETEINGRPTVVYDIEKKSGVADFISQPGWRNERHKVTDIRVSDTSPSVFYVIARRPDLDQEVFDYFLNSLEVESSVVAVNFPVEEFRQRITKKPFAIYITPENSPIQPERFAGYHTGVDVEYSDVDEEVVVSAIAAGQVVFSDWVSGYGGVVVISHVINNKNYLIIYGHLNPDLLPAKDGFVKVGEQIGILGQVGTTQTDGERKHLHLAVYNDMDLNLQGYVQKEEELGKWIDPLALFPLAY